MPIDNEILTEKRNLALRGRKIWLEIKGSNKPDENWVLIIFPTNDHQLNKSAVDNLPAFLKRKYLNGAILVACEDNLLIDGLSVIDCPIVSRHLSESDMEAILAYYKLQQFFKNIVIVSTDEPFGCDAIIGKCGITLDDYVADAIYV